ncbi:MAG: hypothetical protein P1V18_01755 [Candidatus Gracilibacteria bacterium]|nr:hypothetical protein [Candidatus Gracilibacteria bacterium]
METEHFEIVVEKEDGHTSLVSQLVGQGITVLESEVVPVDGVHRFIIDGTKTSRVKIIRAFISIGFEVVEENNTQTPGTSQQAVA